MIGTCTHGDDILERPADLYRGHVQRGAGAEGGAVEQSRDFFRHGGHRARDCAVHYLAASHLMI